MCERKRPRYLVKNTEYGKMPKEMSSMKSSFILHRSTQQNQKMKDVNKMKVKYNWNTSLHAATGHAFACTHETDYDEGPLVGHSTKTNPNSESQKQNFCLLWLEARNRARVTEALINTIFRLRQKVRSWLVERKHVIGGVLRIGKKGKMALRSQGS